MIEDCDIGETLLSQYRYQDNEPLFQRVAPLDFAQEEILESADLVWIFGDTPDNCLTILSKRNPQQLITRLDLREFGIQHPRDVAVVSF